jgi:glucose-6-phosphate isomerase
LELGVKMKSITDCLSWAVLEAHYHDMRDISIKQLFFESKDRFSHFSLDVADLFIDYSKNWITEESIDLLCALAEERRLPAAIQALFSGEKINYSEQRPALHALYRLPPNKPFILNGIDLACEAQNEFQKIASIAEELKKGKLLGYSGKPINTILHVGMGGSGLGPAFYYQAIPCADKKATCYFLTEFDYSLVQSTLAHCNPETTIVAIVSKTFTTQETMTIYKSLKQWLCDAAGNEEKAQNHFYAVTAECERAQAHGFLKEHIFKIWDWVGGRFSIWSAVSFSVILSLGVDHFKRFLAGAYQMDQHFQNAPLKKNIPVIMGLLSVWYGNFFHSQAQAIIPYSARLGALPLYLQQLHMESLGKNISSQGNKIHYTTGRVIFGDTGPRSQHSFHQLLMQGNSMIPVDFILPLRDDVKNDYDAKRAAFCLSQSQTLMLGFDAPNAVQAIAGGRPSTTIMLDCLMPETLGALIALYEHKVFVESIIWDINAFDQWGVERAKQVAQELEHCIGESKKLDNMDSSTAGLLKRISRSLCL